LGVGDRPFQDQMQGKAQMPKKKSKRMARRRFKVTGTGKLKRRHAYKGHILTKKTRKRKRKLRQSAMVSHADRRLIKLFQV
jgi:large subunit ribosomal protein L35